MDNSGGFTPAPFQAQYVNSNPVAQQAKRPGLLSRVVSGITAAPKFFINTDIVNPIKQLAAEATGNKVAERNAVKSQFGGTTSPGKALEQIAGNTAQLGLMATGAPEIGSGGFLGKVAGGAIQGAGFGASGAAGEGGSASDILHGAEVGGVTGGAIGGAGSVVGKIVGKASSKLAANAAAKTASEDASNLAPYAGVATKGNVSGLSDLMKNQLGSDVAPETVQKTTGVLTGPNGFINGTKQSLIAQAGPVNVEGLAQKVQDSTKLPENAAALGDPLTKGTAGNSLYNSMLEKAQSMQGPGGPGLVDGKINTATADSGAVFNEIQKTEQQMQRLAKAEPGTVGAATRNVLQDYRNTLMDRLQNGSGLNKIIEGYKVPAEDAAAIHDAVAKAGLPPSVAEYGINSLNNAKSLADIRAAEAPLVNASKLAGEANKYAEGPGFIKSTNKAAGLDSNSDVLGKHGYQNARFGMYAAGGGAKAAIAAPLLAARGIQAVANKPGLLEAVTGAGNLASKAADTGVGQVASKLAIPAAVSATGATQPGNSTEASISNPAPQSVSFNDQTGKIELPKTQAASNLGFGSNEVLQAMLQDLATNKGANFSKLNTLYSIAKNEEKAQNPQLNQAGQNQLNASQRAAQGIQNISTAFGQAGETGHGVVSRILGTSVKGVGLPGGGAERDVNTAISSSLPDIAKALGLGSSAAELKQVATLLPNVGDSQAVAQKKLQDLQNRISSYASQYFNNQSNFQDNGNQNDQLVQELSLLQQ